jgi:hypothetical protein
MPFEPADPPFGAGLVARRVRIRRRDAARLRAIIEAYDGLAFLYGDGTGGVFMITPGARAAELDGLLLDLRAELDLTVLPPLS